MVRYMKKMLLNSIGTYSEDQSDYSLVVLHANHLAWEAVIWQTKTIATCFPK